MVAAFVVGVLALVAFVLWELRTKRLMLDPRLFLVRPFSAGALSITLGHVAIFGLFFVGLQYLQQILGYSPLLSGLAAFALSPGAAHLSERVGPAPVIAGGLALGAVGLAALSTLGVGSSYWHVLAGFVLAGAGMALSAAPATHAIVASLPQGKQGVASAVNDLSRELGGVLGIAILGSVLNMGYRSGLADAACLARRSGGCRSLWPPRSGPPGGSGEQKVRGSPMRPARPSWGALAPRSWPAPSAFCCSLPKWARVTPARARKERKRDPS